MGKRIIKLTIFAMFTVTAFCGCMIFNFADIFSG